jgi:DNA modification methylase
MAEPKLEAFRQVERYIGLITADVRTGLSLLPSNLFNVVLTSPPYYWARDYGVDGQIGHEDTVDEFVSTLADTFDEVKRVLHPDGVFFLNIGDSYYSGNGQPHGQDPRSPSRNFMRKKLRPLDRSGWDIPKKSLIGVPWKVAFEMQARGWTLRSAIIWNRGNAFVEPTARDRPYRQYEQVFMFAKSRFYSFDRSALPEEDVWNIDIERNTRIDHNAAFPDKLAGRCIEAASPPGGWVLDPFAGSGTALDVAQKLDRNAVGIDLNPAYTAAVSQLLLSRGNTRVEWKDLVTNWDLEPHGWKDWRGNRQNFTKPGSKKLASESQAAG